MRAFIAFWMLVATANMQQHTLSPTRSGFRPEMPSLDPRLASSYTRCGPANKSPDVPQYIFSNVRTQTDPETGAIYPSKIGKCTRTVLSADGREMLGAVKEYMANAENVLERYSVLPAAVLGLKDVRNYVLIGEKPWPAPCDLQTRKPAVYLSSVGKGNDNPIALFLGKPPEKAASAPKPGGAES